MTPRGPRTRRARRGAPSRGGATLTRGAAGGRARGARARTRGPDDTREKAVTISRHHTRVRQFSAATTRVRCAAVISRRHTPSADRRPAAGEMCRRAAQPPSPFSTSTHCHGSTVGSSPRTARHATAQSRAHSTPRLHHPVGGWAWQTAGRRTTTQTPQPRSQRRDATRRDAYLQGDGRRKAQRRHQIDRAPRAAPRAARRGLRHRNDRDAVRADERELEPATEKGATVVVALSALCVCGDGASRPSNRSIRAQAPRLTSGWIEIAPDRSKTEGRPKEDRSKTEARLGAHESS